MASNFVAQMIRTYGEFIGAIYRACGSRPFTQSELGGAGIEIPNRCSLQKLHARGCTVRVKGVIRGACVWRLSPQVLTHYASQEVRS